MPLQVTLVTDNVDVDQSLISLFDALTFVYIFISKAKIESTTIALYWEIINECGSNALVVYHKLSINGYVKVFTIKPSNAACCLPDLICFKSRKNRLRE